MAVSSTVPVLLDVESNDLALVVALTRHSSAYSLRLWNSCNDNRLTIPMTVRKGPRQWPVTVTIDPPLPPPYLDESGVLLHPISKH